MARVFLQNVYHSISWKIAFICKVYCFKLVPISIPIRIRILIFIPSLCECVLFVHSLFPNGVPHRCWFFRLMWLFDIVHGIIINKKWCNTWIPTWGTPIQLNLYSAWLLCVKWRKSQFKLHNNITSAILVT